MVKVKSLSMHNLKDIKKEFNINGFVILKKVFLKDQIKKLLKEVEKIKKKSINIKNPHLHFTKDKKINTIHNINNYVKNGPVIDFSKNKKILSVVSYILNGRVKVRNIEFFLKPKKTGLKSPFHQDNAYWNFSNKKEVLNAWIACSESNFKNGGMCYYIKSHKLGLLNHEISYAPGSSEKIPSKKLKTIKLKKFYPKLNEGDCILHHSEVIHGSSPNKSNKDRVGLVIGYKNIKAKLNKKRFNKHKKIVTKNINYLKKTN